MELQRRNDKFDTIFHTYLSQRERHKELIDVFDDDMALLHQVKYLQEGKETIPVFASDVTLPIRAASKPLNSGYVFKSNFLLADPCFSGTSQGRDREHGR